MTLDTAEAIWGAEAMRKALDEPNPDPVSAELAAEIRRRADPPGVLRAWALTLPWPRFCTVVRIVSGVEREEVTRHGDET